MAGGETSGPAMASRSMFHGATWVLTSDGSHPDDLATLSDVVTSFGANPLVMTAAEHDAAVARVSHLPHVLASALIGLAAGDPKALGLAGGGFRDLTRIAGSESHWWTEVLRANSSQVGEAIDELQMALETWQALISTGSGPELAGRLDSARDARAALERAPHPGACRPTRPSRGDRSCRPRLGAEPCRREGLPAPSWRARWWRHPHDLGEGLGQGRPDHGARRRGLRGPNRRLTSTVAGQLLEWRRRSDSLRNRLRTRTASGVTSTSSSSSIHSMAVSRVSRRAV